MNALASECSRQVNQVSAYIAMFGLAAVLETPDKPDVCLVSTMLCIMAAPSRQLSHPECDACCLGQQTLFELWGRGLFGSRSVRCEPTLPAEALDDAWTVQAIR